MGTGMSNIPSSLQKSHLEMWSISEGLLSLENPALDGACLILGLKDRSS